MAHILSLKTYGFFITPLLPRANLLDLEAPTDCGADLKRAIGYVLNRTVCLDMLRAEL